MRAPHIGSFPFRLVVFFAANPDEELLTSDMRVKFGISRTSCCQLLRTSVDSGWISKRPNPEPTKPGITENLYTAGPELLRLIGRAA